MFKLFSRRMNVTRKRAAKPPLRPFAQARISLKERYRLADTDGARRRMLQTMEDNRIL